MENNKAKEVKELRRKFIADNASHWNVDEFAQELDTLLEAYASSQSQPQVEGEVVDTDIRRILTTYFSYDPELWVSREWYDVHIHKCVLALSNVIPQQPLPQQAGEREECPKCKALSEAIAAAANKPIPEAIEKMRDLSGIDMKEPFTKVYPESTSAQPKEEEFKSDEERQAYNTKHGITGLDHITQPQVPVTEEEIKKAIYDSIPSTTGDNYKGYTCVGRLDFKAIASLFKKEEGVQEITEEEIDALWYEFAHDNERGHAWTMTRENFRRAILSLLKASPKEGVPVTEEDARIYFDNHFNCYVAVDYGNGKLTEEPAMTKEIFIKSATFLFKKHESKSKERSEEK